MLKNEDCIEELTNEKLVFLDWFLSNYNYII